MVPSTAINNNQPGWIKEISVLINHLTGIQLGEKQAMMLESRLQKRIRELRLKSPEEYLDFVKGHVDTEGAHLVSLLTTHHTYFFREFGHFEYLEKEALPKILAEMKTSGRKVLRVWSAACSQGQEAYSLAMFFFHHLRQMAPDVKVEILGTDVDPDSVGKAKNGVYRWNDVKEIPLIYLWTHWARGTGEIRDYVKAKRSLKDSCRFEVQNLLQTADPKQGQTYDIIFCRNVFIYFTSEQCKAISLQLLKHLNPNGYFFIGTSESLVTLNLNVEAVAASVYRHKQSKSATAVLSKPALKSMPTAASAAAPKTLSTPTTATSEKKKVRVLCVDDSPTVLTLLKKILSEDFEIVATAKNGIEAKEMLKKHTVDVVTLDIHMPEQNGLEYLRANMNAKHPPVVMITSVPREDSKTAFECLQLGAVDYVEKPSLSDLANRTDEIRTKVRCAAVISKSRDLNAPEIDRSFHTQFKITDVEEKIRIISAGARDRNKIATLASEFTDAQPPTVVFLEGANGIIPSLRDFLTSKCSAKIEVLQNARSLTPGTIYLGDFSTQFDEVKQVHGSKVTSFIALGDTSKELSLKIKSWPDVHLIMEDLEVELSPNHKELMKRAKYFVPYTSMAYHSIEFFSKAKNGK